ncbi:MAG: hypothetical protein IPM46_09890 [Flavobacteriales bacterium]|nr:hypothetical protein [Flavobacteriales bacterium]
MCLQFNFGHPQAPRIGTTADAVDLAINAYGAFSSAIRIPCSCTSLSPAPTLTATGIEQVGLTCILGGPCRWNPVHHA